LANDLALGDAVTFTGRVPHEDVERYYGLIDILVYPRLSQRLTELVTPLKPLEAMAQGKIVVASDVGGHREMVFPGRNGVLFKAGDPASLSEACIDLLRKPETWAALSENGRNYVATERSWATNVKIYDNLYERIITRRTGVPQESAEPMGRQ
jgi:glycosyltransferase involved in cell wall biosynthesis